MEGSPSSRRRMSLASGRRKEAENGGGDSIRRLSLSRSMNSATERTVKRLRLSKALTIPENTTVFEACRRMAARRVDAVLLTDANALLCGILTAKDVATRVIASELKLDETPISKVMSRNPVFVLSDTLAVEALQKMVQGRFRHLPVVENGEVIAILDIAKCLYDAIARMERAAEKGRAIAAAVEGVEKQWGVSVTGPSTFIDSLRERMFKPSLSTIIPENPKVAIVSPTDSVLSATKMMIEHRLNSIVVEVDNKPHGILTYVYGLRKFTISYISHASSVNSDLSKTLLSNEKSLYLHCISLDVMTPNPECGTIDTSIVDALHKMQNGKFLHLPVVDRDGKVVFVIDVIHITHAAVATVGSSGGDGNEASTTMMQKFWDSALELGPGDDDDSQSEGSFKLASEGTDTGRYTAYQSPLLPNTFIFKLEDKRGRLHRFICDTRSLTDVMAAILQRVGDNIDQNSLPLILYEDEDLDKVILASDEDLTAAVEHAKLAGWKGLRLHLDYTGSGGHRKQSRSSDLAFAQKEAWTPAYGTVAAGAALVAGLGVMAFLKRASS